MVWSAAPQNPVDICYDRHGLRWPSQRFVLVKFMRGLALEARENLSAATDRPRLRLAEGTMLECPVEVGA